MLVERRERLPTGRWVHTDNWHVTSSSSPDVAAARGVSGGTLRGLRRAGSGRSAYR